MELSVFAPIHQAIVWNLKSKMETKIIKMNLNSQNTYTTISLLTLELTEHVIHKIICPSFIRKVYHFNTINFMKHWTRHSKIPDLLSVKCTKWLTSHFHLTFFHFITFDDVVMSWRIVWFQSHTYAIGMCFSVRNLLLFIPICFITFHM